MAIDTTTNKTIQECNGALTGFVFTFPVTSANDLQVIMTYEPTGAEQTLALTTDYTVTPSSNDYADGGTVTTVATWTSDYTITIYRSMDFLQSSDFTENMPTLYETFENGLDKLAMEAQQLNESVNRTIRIKKSDVAASLELPLKADRASKYLAFNGDGEPIVATGTPQDLNNPLYDNYYLPDYLAADQGLTGASNTIKYYVDLIGTTNKATIYLRHNSGSEYTDYAFGTNETIPSNITLVFERGARLAIATGVTVTINSQFNPGLHQVFSCTGTGKVVFGAGSVKEVYPEMWGAISDGSTDCTTAITKAIASVYSDTLGTSGTVRFINSDGYTKYYKTTSLITVEGPASGGTALVLEGSSTGLSGLYYGGFIKNTATSIFSFKGACITLKNMCFVGNGGAGGVGATIDAVHMYGTLDGDMDSEIDNCSFLNVAVGVRTYGRNINIKNSTFSNSLRGVFLGAPDAVYHTGPNASQLRGLIVTNNRFHNIGVSGSTYGCIETGNSNVIGTRILNAIISGNFFDSDGYSIPVKIVGYNNTTNPHTKITVSNNKAEKMLSSSLIYMENTFNSEILDNQLSNDSGDTTNGGYGIYVKDSNTINILNNSILQSLYDGIFIDGVSLLNIKNNTVISASTAAAGTHSGIIIDATSNFALISNNMIYSAKAYGIDCEGTNISMSNNMFGSCLLGNIKSNVGCVQSQVFNNITSIVGEKGTYYNVGAEAFDFTAATPALVGTITFANTYGSGYIEVEMTGRDGAAGNCYVISRRYIRPESATPVYATIGSDNLAEATITYASGGAGIIKISITTTRNVFGTVVIRTSGGADTNTTDDRGITLVM